MPSILVARMFAPTFPLDDQSLVGCRNIHVVFRQPRQIGVNYEIISGLPDFDGGYPVRVMLRLALSSEVTPERRESPVDVLRESPHERNRAHRKEFTGAHGKDGRIVAACSAALDPFGLSPRESLRPY